MPSRIAFVTPLPPLASGIADYSAALLPHLAVHFDITIFAEPGSRLAVPDADLPVRPLDALPAAHARRPFDAVLYQLGNNGDFHAGAYRMLSRVPGIVMLHELVLHHMVRELTLVAGDRDGYLEEIRYCCGRSGYLLAKRSLDTGTPFDVWSYPLFERVVDASRGVLVHSEESRRRVLASRPQAAVEVVPSPWFPGLRAAASVPGAAEETASPAPLSGAKLTQRVKFDGSSDRREVEPEAQTSLETDAASSLRRRLGLPANALLICSFGYMTRAKRLDVVLRAFTRFATHHPEALFLIVGEVSKDNDVPSLVPAALRPRVVAAGRPPLATFLAYMEAADVAVNLRYPSAGETSATLVELMGLGKPVIVTDAGSFAELPDGCVAKVEPNESEEDLLVAYLEALAADPDLRRRLGENARRHADAHLRVDRAAARHAAAIGAICAAGLLPAPPVPPLAPYPPEDVLSDVVAGMTADAVDLGASEGEEDLLRGLACDIVDLGLDGGL
jgi:glycosyltransferase involved in cell wall biosynthesis